MFMEDEAILDGSVQCPGNTALEVTKSFVLGVTEGWEIRCKRYRYNGKAR